MSSGPSLYNPRDTKPEQLDALLTGRTALLEELLQNLREQAAGATRQHWLLRGQRGMGKTHLAGVIHHRVKTQDALNRTYLPLWLGEADTYEVYSAATLLKIIGERLAEETKDPALLERLNAVEGIGDEEGYFQEMVELLTAEAARRERVLLVLMENLDALLGSFGPKERKEQTRQLRSLLLHNPRFLFISTTPTYYLNNPLDDPKEPLYAHLKERDLDHLTEPETEQLLRKLAQLHPRAGAESFLDGKDGRLRLRVIHRLTGGLPRSLVMGFTVIREAAGIGSLVQELRALLDAQTAYFEARLSQLPARERAIVTTMALAPTNLTMKEIATRSHLPEKTLSTLMSRLEKDGHIRPTSRAGGKGTVYELSEGLFRLWYQYRKGRPVLEPLVEFLAYWYGVEELERVVAVLRKGAQVDSATRAAELALFQAEEALRRASSEEGQQERERFWAECQQAIQAEQANVLVDEWAKELAKQILQASFLLKDPAHAEHGRASIRKLLQRAPLEDEQLRPFLLPQALKAISQTAIFIKDAGALSAIFSILLELYGRDTNAKVQLVMDPARFTIAMMMLPEHPQRAVEEANFIIASGTPSKPMALIIRGLALHHQQKTDAAIMSLEEAIRGLTAPGEQLVLEGLVLRAMSTLAKLYDEKQNKEQASAIRERLINRFKGHQKEPFRFQVASAKVRLVLDADGAQAITAWENWLAEYGSIDEPSYQELRTSAQLLLSLERIRAGRGDSRESVTELVESAVQGNIRKVQFFFHFAILFFIMFGPQTMKGWLSRLYSAQLSEETRLLVSWHLMAAEILIEDEDGPIAQRARARLPPKLRPNVEELVKKVREARAELNRKG